MVDLSGPGLARGIREDLVSTWDDRAEFNKEKFKGIIKFGVPSENAVELYGYEESEAVANRLPWGEEPPDKPVATRTWSVPNYRFMLALRWLRLHREKGKLFDVARKTTRAVKRMQQVTERVFYEVLQGSATILPGLPAQPDGAAGMFAATDGSGAARFGVSGGNIKASQTFTSGPAFRSAIWNGIEQLASFLDPEGQPAQEDCNEFTVITPVAMMDVAAEAFNQATGLGAVTTATSNAGVSNVFQDSGIKFRHIATPRITASTAVYMFATDSDVEEPFFEQILLADEDHFWDANNSVFHQRKGIEELNMEGWRGFGNGLPLNALKLTT